MTTQLETASSGAPAKPPTKHTRKPSAPPPPGSDNLEEVLLHKLDSFLYQLETRLDDIEAFGLQKIGQVDESVQHAYEGLVRVRGEVMGEGWRKADALVRIIEEHYNHAVQGHDIKARLTQAMRHIEDKLEDIENKCGQFLDGTVSAAVALALQVAASRLLNYDELPSEWQENPYILRGYRFCKGYMDCVYSLVAVHNETCNIWIHLVGFFVMLALSFYHLPTTISWQDSTLMDKICLIVFLVAAMKCLVCSAVWHTFNGISHLKAKQNFACVDYTGITVLIAASILTTEYTAFYCNPVARNTYMTVTALSGLGGVLFTWDPSFDKQESRTKRILFFVGFAVAGGLGFCHAAYYHGLLETFAFYLPVFKSLLCYTLGVVVYGLLIPERWCPGSIFDYFGMSHNLWHISVFGGIYYHYVATVDLLQGAREFSCAGRR
jgi:adiponectin receptor